MLHWYHISRFLSTLSLRRATRSGGPWQAGCRDFYPRSPCGERPCSASRYFSMPSYFYPRSPCGERLSFIIYSITDNCISIHALLAESDIELAFLAINPITFLSTLSLRRATPGAKSTTPERYYFYPRSPCGERQPARPRSGTAGKISIHALLAESDLRAPTALKPASQFLSTLSLRRATSPAI